MVLAIDSIDEDGDILVQFVNDPFRENEWVSEEDLKHLNRIDGVNTTIIIAFTVIHVLSTLCFKKHVTVMYNGT